METVTFRGDIMPANYAALLAYAKGLGMEVVPDQISVTEKAFNELSMKFFKTIYLGREILVGGLNLNRYTFDHNMVDIEISRINNLPIIRSLGVLVKPLDQSVCFTLDRQEGLSEIFPDWVSFGLDPSGTVLYRNCAKPHAPERCDMFLNFPRSFVVLVWIQPVSE